MNLITRDMILGKRPFPADDEFPDLYTPAFDEVLMDMQKAEEKWEHALRYKLGRWIMKGLQRVGIKPLWLRRRFLSRKERMEYILEHARKWA